MGDTQRRLGGCRIGEFPPDTSIPGRTCRIQEDSVEEIKKSCDDMFAHLCQETGLPRGYIDVVLWKSCQVKLISMDDYLHKPPVM